MRRSGRQETVGRPISVQIELVEGCNRLCDFCGLKGIRTKANEDIRTMGMETVRRAARELATFAPEARIEFAMHGEPLLHPMAIVAMGVFRAHLPWAQLQLTTNGRTLMKDTDERVRGLLYGAGLDFLVVDTYEPERDRLQAALRSVKPQTARVLDFYDDLAPKRITPWQRSKALRGTVIIMDDLGKRDGEHRARVILNHGGNAGPAVPEPLHKTCTNPFRELTICYDGDVNICCMDWGHEFVCGNVNEESLAVIWYGPRFTAARHYLNAKRREMVPCSRCNKGAGARAGLLPKLGPVTPEHEETMAEMAPRKATA